MINVPVIARRELQSYFLSPGAYVVLTLFALIHGMLFVLPLALAGTAPGQDVPIDPNYLAASACQAAVYLLLVFAPIITMGLLSQEFASGTVEALLTSPVSAMEVVAGKYAAALLFALVMLVPVGLECVYLGGMEEVDGGTVASGLLGVYLVTAQFLAVGLFCSSLTRVQIASALCGVVLLLLFQLLWMLVARSSSPAAQALRYLPPAGHMGDLLAGVVSTRDLVYFAATTALFVFLSGLGLEARRLQGMLAGAARGALWKRISRAGILVGAALLGVSLAAGDVTAYGLSPAEGLSAALTAARWSGAVILTLCLLANADAFVRLVRRRQAPLGANLLVTAMLAVATCALLCHISTRRYARQDMTAGRLYSLSQKTRRMVRSLKEPVKVSVVYFTPKSDVYEQAYSQAVGMLAEFRHLNPRITVQEISLGDQPGMAELKDRVGNVPDRCFVFESGDRRQVVPLPETVLPPAMPGGRPRFMGESAFASALIRLSDRTPRRAYFLTGHGERPMKGAADAVDARFGPERSLSRLAEQLQRDGFSCRPLNLTVELEVPADCSALIVADPTSALPVEHLRAIGRYLDARSGRALFMIGSRAGAGETPAGPEPLLERYGMRVRADLLGMHAAGRGDVQPLVPVTGEGFATHPVTRDLRNYTISLLNCAPVEILRTTPLPGLECRIIMTSISSGWAARTPAGPDPGGLTGPFAVAAVCQPAAYGVRGPEVVVVGSSRSFTDEEVERHPENLYPLVNAVNWMAGRMAMLSIPPKDMQLGRARLTAARVRAAEWAFLALLPGCFVILGAAVWALRR